jgi:hypothetical protein
MAYSDLQDYYLRWYHQRPVAITPQRRDELRRVHRCLMACIGHFVADYERLTAAYMPLGDKELEILSRQSQYPFRAGTFRPDYLISAQNQLLLCEITSRFFAHGLFMSWFNRRFLERWTGGAAFESRFPELMEYMRKLPGGSRRMFVLKSADRTSEIRLYERFYRAEGLEFTVLEAPEVEARRAEWDRPGTFIVSALNQQDILGFGMDTLCALMERGMVSDFRTVFLLHDKRFFHLLSREDFTAACLPPEDAAFFRKHVIPTYLAPPPDARENKDAYILKPWRLGKSEGVVAGVLSTDEEWKSLFDSGAAERMVAQPFIDQRTFPTVWEGTPFRDYACGMMLCVDDLYFDSGYFRCSSCPVTNRVDDRKAAALHTSDPALLALCDVL